MTSSSSIASAPFCLRRPTGLRKLLAQQAFLLSRMCRGLLTTGSSLSLPPHTSAPSSQVEITSSSPPLCKIGPVRRNPLRLSDCSVLLRRALQRRCCGPRSGNAVRPCAYRPRRHSAVSIVVWRAVHTHVPGPAPQGGPSSHLRELYGAGIHLALLPRWPSHRVVCCRRAGRRNSA